MPSVLESLPRGAPVAIVRLRSLGDCVLTTPAIHLLKNARPDLRLAVVVEPPFRPVFAGNPDIEDLFDASLAMLRRWRPQLCLNFHGGGTSARLTALSGARWRAGFGHFRCQQVYNVRIPRAQEILGVERKVHTAEHLASAMFYLGVPPGDIPRARLFAEPPPSAPPYAVIHPIASEPGKTWDAAGFLAVAEHLEHKLDLQPVFIAGPGEDLAPFQAWRTVAGAPLESVKSLVGGANLFVGNDSGPAHMAAAFGVPVVAIFGNSDLDNWYPWRTAAEVVRHPAGITAVGVGQVVKALDRLRVRA